MYKLDSTDEFVWPPALVEGVPLREDMVADEDKKIVIDCDCPDCGASFRQVDIEDSRGNRVYVEYSCGTTQRLDTDGSLGETLTITAVCLESKTTMLIKVLIGELPEDNPVVTRARDFLRENA